MERSKLLQFHIGKGGKRPGVAVPPLLCLRTALCLTEEDLHMVHP